MIRFQRMLRALGLTLALGGAAAAAAAPPPQAALATRLGDPAQWSTFGECLDYLERWAGRELPDWLVHSAVISYPSRKPLYDRSGDPLLDAAGKQSCATVNESGRVFFPPAWRLLGKSRRLPLVLYPHATMLEKTHVPSEYGGHEWMVGAAAALYYGYAVAMPDQPGMGGDSQARHPFCHAKSLAYSTLDALPALERLVGEDPYLIQRRYGWDGSLYIMGYSEGAYTALAAVKELETHPGGYGERFTLKGSACMAGPFDLSDTTRKAIIDPVTPFAHCFYLPYVIMGYQDIYGELMDPQQAFAPALLQPREDGNVVQWVGGCIDGLLVDSLIGRRLGVPGDAVVLRSILNPAWLARELDDPAYATSGLRKILLENDLCGGWRPTRPILFCQSLTDRDVSIQNTVRTMAGLGEEIRQAGGDPSRLLAFLPLGGPSDRISHVQGALVAIPAAFNWIYSGMPVD
jgi:pimeloyl-ACP methyl ester carboxylesterase